MTRVLSLLVIAFLITQQASAQHVKPTLPAENSVQQEGENVRTPIQQLECKGLVKIDPNAKVWSRTLKHYGIQHESDDKQRLKALKAAKLIEKRNTKIAGTSGNTNNKAATPIVNANFNGNAFDFSTPSDNSMAISNGGIIVSAINSTLNYYNTNGTLIASSSFNSIVNDPTLNGKYFDPKVLYDAGADRFIFVILHDATPATSKVIVGFSQTNDPTAGWFIYVLSGDPLNDNSWFDYPSIAVSGQDLFIAGNLFDASDVFRQTIVFQMEKTPAFSGGTVSFSTWNNISGSPFNILPVSFGQQGNYGPGIFMVSSSPSSSGSYSLFDITNDLGSSPAMNRFIVPTTTYSAPADASQAGSGDLVATNDSRALSGFFLDNTVHFVHNVDVLSGWSGIRYTRIDVNTRTATSSNFGNAGVEDYAFPAIASFGGTATNKSVMISFQVSSSSDFPGVGVVNCDQNMVWSAKRIVKAGDNFVDIVPGDERWGDYTGMARKQNATAPTVWLAASYANNSNTYTARIAEITAGDVPVVNFSGTPTSGQVPLVVQFQDNSTLATGRKWTFPGGTPSTSTSASPVVTYIAPGDYDVTLEATNVFGSAQETKTDYINAKISTVGVEETANATSAAVFPNPVADHFKVSFDMAETAMIQVAIFTIDGKKVTTLFEGMAKTGKNVFSFNTMSLDNGIYFIHINQGAKQLVNEKLVVTH
jgi:PKD repeat protein